VGGARGRGHRLGEMEKTASIPEHRKYYEIGVDPLESPNETKMRGVQVMIH